MVGLERPGVYQLSPARNKTKVSKWFYTKYMFRKCHWFETSKHQTPVINIAARVKEQGRYSEIGLFKTCLPLSRPTPMARALTRKLVETVTPPPLEGTHS